MDQGQSKLQSPHKVSKSQTKSTQRHSFHPEHTSTQKSILKLTNAILTSPPPTLKLSTTKSCRSGKLIFPDSPKFSNSSSSLTESFLRDLKFPTSPSTIISGLPSLPEWTKLELQTYSSVFYMSRSEKPLLNPAEIEQDGEMRVSIGDDIEYRYEILGHLGKGSFGEVLKAQDHEEKKTVALKIIKNKPRFKEQAQSEIDILKFLMSKNADSKSNLVSFIRNFCFRNHLVLVFELLSENLYEHLRSNNFRGLKVQQIKKFAYQVLKGLSCLESQNLIHCDIKPENLLIQAGKTSSIKMIDFGSSCFVDRQVFTYIQSRFYRAPEIVLGMRYSPAIDIWSFGCLLIELYNGIPLFPAENEKELIACITEVLGEPSVEYLNKGTRSHIYFYSDGRIKPFQNSRGRRRYPGCRSLRSVLKGADNELIALVESCLQWDPEARVKACNAIKLPWICETVKSPKVYGRFCKLSMEDIVKHTPHLRGLMGHKGKPSAVN